MNLFIFALSNSDPRPNVLAMLFPRSIFSLRSHPESGRTTLKLYRP
jgi:hypothetical protein